MTMNTTSFAKLQWYDSKNSNILAFGDLPIYDNLCISFSIKYGTNGDLLLIDHSPPYKVMKQHVVSSVEEAKVKAQQLSDAYCMEILRNIYDN